jgi:hypothetical protein
MTEEEDWSYILYLLWAFSLFMLVGIVALDWLMQ